jgi:hypothetical protein
MQVFFFILSFLSENYGGHTICSRLAVIDNKDAHDAVHQLASKSSEEKLK